MVNLGNNNANVGDDVVLIGSQGNLSIPLESISEKLGTIDYEVLVSFTRRIIREYV